MKPQPMLLPLAVLYGGVIQLRNLLFDKGILRITKVSVPVISVGNITAGGTGKTPMIELIGSFYQKSGKTVGIVSRGYGRTSRGFLVVSDGKKIITDVSSAGDEPFWLAQQLPGAIVAVDENRVRAAERIIVSYKPDIIILDDAFQHRYIHRDLDIVLIDAAKPLGSTSLIPAGYRREPVSAVKRADMIIYTKYDPNVGMQKKTATVNANEFHSTYLPVSVKNLSSGKTFELHEIRGNSCVTVCGIADPSAFNAAVEGLSLSIRERVVKKDHHQYDSNDIQECIAVMQRTGAQWILCTEKDAVKIQRHPNLDLKNFYVLEMAASIVEQNNFETVLEKVTNT